MNTQSKTASTLATPSITKVLDSKEELSNPGQSEDTLLTLSGTADPSIVVSLYDGSTRVRTASVTTLGAWTISSVQALIGSHSFTIRAPDGASSPAWVINVVSVAVKPDITSVVDSKGEVPHNGTTSDTTVTLNGTAAANEVVGLYKDGALLGDVPVNASSAWTRPVTGLTVSSHNFQALGRYGSNPVSDVRSLTVSASAVPTIGSVKDAGGVEIRDGEATFSTSVTLTGTAAAGEQVQILDGATVLDTVTAAGGNWTLASSSLTIKAYSIKAIGLYGSNPESAVRGFTVAAATTPTISSVRDSKGEVANGGSTTDTAVSLVGTAVANQQVQILDNGANKGLASVNATGGWNLSISGLVLGGHSITAKAIYGSQPVSNARTFTVRPPTPPLVIDTSSATLNGKLYSPGATNPISWPANTTITRMPTSGAPPYTYTSENTQVVTVSEGVVRAQHNGATTITVRDSAGQTATYTVVVTGVILCVGLGNVQYPAAVKNAQAAGKRIPALAELGEIYQQYKSNWPMGNAYYWSATSAGGFPASNYILNLVNGGQSTAYNGPVGGFANAIGI